MLCSCDFSISWPIFWQFSCQFRHFSRVNWIWPYPRLWIKNFFCRSIPVRQFYSYKMLSPYNPTLFFTSVCLRMASSTLSPSPIEPVLYYRTCGIKQKTFFNWGLPDRPSNCCLILKKDIGLFSPNSMSRTVSEVVSKYLQSYIQEHIVIH